MVGGGSKNALWRRVLADAFQLPLRFPVEPESAALGAALQVGGVGAACGRGGGGGGGAVWWWWCILLATGILWFAMCRRRNPQGRMRFRLAAGAPGELAVVEPVHVGVQEESGECARGQAGSACIMPLQARLRAVPNTHLGGPPGPSQPPNP